MELRGGGVVSPGLISTVRMNGVMGSKKAQIKGGKHSWGYRYLA
jgi:hypothetical protein